MILDRNYLILNIRFGDGDFGNKPKPKNEKTDYAE